MNILKCIAICAAAASSLLETACTKGGDYDSPRVPEGSVVAVAVDKVNLFTRLQTILGEERFAEFKKQFASSDGDSLDKFLEDAGMAEKDFKWGAFTSALPEFDEEGNTKVPDLAAVLRIDHDGAKFFAAVKKQFGEKLKEHDAQFVDGNVAGVNVLIAKPLEAAVSNDEFLPVFASLDGQLLIVTPDTQFMEKMILLYRDGKGESAKFRDFALGSNSILVAKAVDFGENISKTPIADSLKNLNELLPEGEKIARDIKNIEATVEILSDGKSGKSVIVAEMASEEDAATAKRAIDENLNKMKGMMALAVSMNKEAADDPSTKMMFAFLCNVKVEAEESKLTISVEGEVDLVSLIANAKTIK